MFTVGAGATATLCGNPGFFQNGNASGPASANSSRAPVMANPLISRGVSARSFTLSWIGRPASGEQSSAAELEDPSEPGAERRGDRLVRAERVGAGDRHDLAALGGGRHPERVALALDDEHRDVDGVELGQPRLLR